MVSRDADQNILSNVLRGIFWRKARHFWPGLEGLARHILPMPVPHDQSAQLKHVPYTNSQSGTPNASRDRLAIGTRIFFGQGCCQGAERVEARHEVSVSQSGRWSYRILGRFFGYLCLGE